MRILTDRKEIKQFYDADDTGKYVTILGLECQNIEPIKWQPNFDFNAQSIGGKLFERIDLSDRDWADFDDQSNLSVSVTNLDYKLEDFP